MNTGSETLETAPDQPRWQALNSRQRRVLGVLVEKAKTTPDAYPLTLNSLTSGCNQKSNRSPQMNLSTDDVEQVIDELREAGAVTEVQGSGRVPKYRHHAYEWLGVDKVELAVMTELLLRGEQTVGELRSRAARMEQISGLNELKPVLQSLIAKKLVLSLTPEGRGQIVTHGLYKDRELAELQTQVGRLSDAAGAAHDGERESVASTTRPQPNVVGEEALALLQTEIGSLRDEVAELRERVEKFEQLMG